MITFFLTIIEQSGEKFSLMEYSLIPSAPPFLYFTNPKSSDLRPNFSNNYNVRKGWARSEIFEIVPFRSRTKAFSQIIPFQFLFFNRSVLVPFRSVLSKRTTIPFRSWRSQSKNGSIPLIPFLVKNVFIPRTVPSKEQFHPRQKFIKKSWLKSKK